MDTGHRLQPALQLSILSQSLTARREEGSRTSVCRALAWLATCRHPLSAVFTADSHRRRTLPTTVNSTGRGGMKRTATKVQQRFHHHGLPPSSFPQRPLCFGPSTSRALPATRLTPTEVLRVRKCKRLHLHHSRCFKPRRRARTEPVLPTRS